MDNSSLRISVIQSHITWEDRAENLGYFEELIRRTSGRSHLAVLPELFTTGLSMRVHDLAETMDGETVTSLKAWAKKFDLAITGSFIATEGGNYYNRVFFIMPDGQEAYYDKHHLFRMAGEDNYFAAGKERLIVNYRGWKICPMVCYDLRFPVWSRNVCNEYDLLIYVANWVDARKKAWKSLLQARAIENMAYVCGVNRVGADGRGYVYHGGSYVFSPKGKKMIDAGDNEEVTRTCKLKKADLEILRTKFPVWKDADSFVLK
ncbi:MAG: amidohydrolase [Tannerella sp.]|jgi:predicted amidohydrolase|nr:amidohydrolase [Tannerella sp.]